MTTQMRFIYTCDGAYLALLSPSGFLLKVHRSSSVSSVAPVYGLVPSHASGPSHNVSGSSSSLVCRVNLPSLATCLAPAPNRTQILAGTANGLLFTIDVTDGSILKTTNIGAPIAAMACPMLAARGSVVYLSVHKATDGPGGGASAAPSSTAASSSAGRILRRDLRQPKASDILGKSAQVAKIVVTSSRGGYVGWVDRRTVVLCDTLAAERTSHITLHHTKALTALAIDADDKRVAAGDVTGRVLVWHGLPQPTAATGAAAAGAADPAMAKAPSHVVTTHPLDTYSCTTLHWHASAVRCASFVPGAVPGAPGVLATGGAEAVLVLWNIADVGASVRPRFLPRLGAPLNSLVSCGDANCAHRLAIGMADGAGLIADVGAMQIGEAVRVPSPSPAPSVWPPSTVVRGSGALARTRRFGGAAATAALMPCSDKGTAGNVVVALACGALSATASASASLQFWDVTNDAHAGMLSVSPRGAVWTEDAAFGAVDAASRTPSAGAVATFSPHVALLAFTADGEALATVDRHPDARPQGGSADVLRFWQRCDKEDAPYLYEPVALADEPHAAAATCLVAVPSKSTTRHCFATASMDGDAKLWMRMSSEDSALYARRQFKFASTHEQAPDQNAPWRCVARMGYRSQPVHALAVTSDGSAAALAVAPRSADSSSTAGACVALFGISHNAATSLLGAVPLPANDAIPTHVAFCRGAAGVSACVAVATARQAGGGGTLLLLDAARLAWACVLEIGVASLGTNAFGTLYAAVDLPEEAGAGAGAALVAFDGRTLEGGTTVLEGGYPTRAWPLPSPADALLFPESMGGEAIVVTADREFIACGDGQATRALGTPAAANATLPSNKASEPLPATTLAALLSRGSAPATAADSASAPSSQFHFKNGGVAELISATPTHELPSPEDLCMAVLDEIMGQ